MQKLMLFRSMCSDAWSDITKNFVAILILIGCFIGINSLSLEMGNYVGVLEGWQANLPFVMPDFVAAHIMRFMQACLAAIAYIFFMQHVLDIVYARKMVWFNYSIAALHACMFEVIVYYILKMQGMPACFSSEDFSSIEDLLFHMNFDASTIILFACILVMIMFIYLIWFRCLFIDLFIIETKCSIKQAINKSWNLAIGNEGLYLACLFVPYLIRVVILAGADYFSGADHLVMVHVQIIAWLSFAWSLLLRAHLFKTLRALSVIE
ncbi:MAG: hypothetical protein Q8Q60_00565 [Candidatus Chromulinivorax sp.]|nr:hypothetical protein [Candidatus Chromulinivorax sp.]